MEDLFPVVAAALGKGEQVVLCTILSSSGSTPRGPGTQMAVFREGGIAGTVGGGGMERSAQAHAQTIFQTGRPDIQRLQLHPNAGEDVGMICGGEVAIAFQLLGEADLPLVEQICAAQEGEQPAWLVTTMPEEGPWSMELWTGEQTGASCVPPERVRSLLGSSPIWEEGEPSLFVKPLARRGTVYIFGAGHVGRELAWILDRVGFRVAMFDDRPEALRPEYFPVGVRQIQGDFGRIDLLLSEADYVVIMTNGHRGDLAVLEQSLAAPVSYIGCIGSRKKAAATREALKAKGFTETDISRIHSPIGLPIGGETPAEIAVSVAAELIAHRAGRETCHG